MKNLVFSTEVQEGGQFGRIVTMDKSFFGNSSRKKLLINLITQSIENK